MIATFILTVLTYTFMGTVVGLAFSPDQLDSWCDPEAL